MNWLAHSLLSRRDIDYQLGNIGADVMKRRDWDGAGDQFLRGMKMHSAIDAFTDSHPLVSQSKSRLGKKGYLKGVVIDVLYDHFLTRGWKVHAATSLDVFLGHFSSRAGQASQKYPPELRAFIRGITQSGRLGSYGSFDGFVHALEQLDQRLTPRIRAKDSTLNYIAAVEKEYPRLMQDFEAFFPELVDYFKNHELGSHSDHFLI